MIKTGRSGKLLTVLFLFHCVLTLCGFSFLSELKNEKGNKLYKKGQVHKAREAYQSALISDPKSPEIAYNLGNALYKENAFKESLTAYGQGAKDLKDPAFGTKAFYNLGNALYRNQDLPKAVEFYKQALRLDSKNDDAKYNLELLLKKLKQNEEQPKDQPKDQKKEPKDPPKDPQKNEGQSGAGGQGSAGEKTGEEKKEEQKEEQKEENKAGSAEPLGAETPKDEDNKQPGESPPVNAPEVKPKTDAERRADQILSALENQEQQVLKFRNDPRKGQVRVRNVAEKDW